MKINGVEELIEIERIKQLKARYFRFLDLHQWQDLATCFTADVEMRFDGAPGSEPLVFDGRDDFINRGGTAMDKISHVHHGHMPEIELLGRDEAKGIWAMVDQVYFRSKKVFGYGHYHETYRREADGEWRIAKLHLTRLRLDVMPL